MSARIDSDLTVNEKLAEIAKQQSVLDAAKTKLIFDRINDCTHEIIFSGSGNAHPHGDDRCVCRNCGLTIEAGIGGLISKEILDFRSAELMLSKNFNAVPKLYILSSVQMCALKYPLRFEEAYLTEVFKDSPYNIDQVLSLDDGRYTWYADNLYGSYEQWYRDNISDD